MASNPPPVDKRNDSLKKYAQDQAKKREEEARKKAEEQKKSSVSIKPENIVRGSGGGSSQVAIQGTAVNNLQVTVVSPSEEEVKEVKSSQASSPSESVKSVFRGETSVQDFQNNNQYSRDVVVQREIEARRQVDSAIRAQLSAPRSVNASETDVLSPQAPEIIKVKPPVKYGGQINVDKPVNKDVKISPVKKFADAFDFSQAELNIKVAETDNPIIDFYGVAVAPALYSGGRVLVNAGVQAFNFGADTRIRGVQPAVFDEVKKIAQGLVDTPEYVVETGGKATESFLAGDIKGLGEVGGEVGAQIFVGEAVGRPVGKVLGSVAKEVKRIPEGAKAVQRSMKFEEAKASTFNSKTGEYEVNIDVGYKFETNKVESEYRPESNTFSPPERVGVLVPQDSPADVLGSINRNPLAEGLQAKELQTQIYPKKLTQSVDEQSVFVTESYKPQSLMELSKTEPELAKQLAMDNGQMVFNPNQPVQMRSVSPEEVIVINREPQVLIQKTLPGYTPQIVNSPLDEVFIVKGNEKVASFKKTNQLEFLGNKKGQANLVNPSEVFSDIYEGGVSVGNKIKDKFKRDSDIKPTLRSEAKPFGVFVPYNSINLVNPPYVEIRSRDASTLIQRPNLVLEGRGREALAVRSESDTDIFQDVGLAVRTRSALAVDVATDTLIDQAQAQSLFLRTEQAQDTGTLQVPKLRLDTFSVEEPPLNPEDPFSPRRTNDSKKKKKNKAFLLEIRKRGKFQDSGVFEDEGQAQRSGFNILQDTASASFRVRDVESGNILASPNVGGDFYSSRKETGVVVQKRRNRIGTMGEKREITFKGIGASRFKNKIRRRVF